jgi:hypothetical protein
MGITDFPTYEANRKNITRYMKAFDYWNTTRDRGTFFDRMKALDALTKGKIETVEQELARAPRCDECHGPILSHRGPGRKPKIGSKRKVCQGCARDLRQKGPRGR